jgi:ribosome-binding factor A
LKRSISEAIQREIPAGPAGLITVNEVDVSPDLRSAKVFVGVLGNAEQQQSALALLRKNRKRFQSHLAQTVILKYTPQLRFFVDDSVVRGNRVLEILDELEKSSDQ